MLNLLRKERKLVMHPTAPMFLALSAMLLIPNYPYYVTFFYTGLAIFFTCLNGRENADIAYTLLPVRKADVVRARFLLSITQEVAQLLLAAGFINALHMQPNQAGMDANLALLGLSFLMLGIFNWVFFTRYYQCTEKVGRAFVLATVAVFIYMLIAEAATFALPIVRKYLDTPDPQHLPQKLLVLVVGVLGYVLLSYRAYRRSVRSFQALDQ